MKTFNRPLTVKVPVGFKYPEYTWRQAIIPKLEVQPRQPLFPPSYSANYDTLCCFEVKEEQHAPRKPYTKYTYQIWLYPSKHSIAAIPIKVAETTLIFGCDWAYENWLDSEINTWIRGTLLNEN